jgi:hypothetical protein
MKSRDQRRAASETPKRQRRAGARGRPEKRRVRPAAKAAQEAFQQRYPTIAVAPALFRLVGVDPPLNPDAEHEALRDALVDWFAEK